MRKLLIPTLVAGSLALSGCMSGLGGLGGYGYNDPIAGVLGSVLGGIGTQGYGSRGYDYGSSSRVSADFQNAAINACGRQASQYGQVSVSDVRQQSGDTLRVDGRVATNFDQRSWACSFRADGRITDFRMGRRTPNQ